MLIREVIDRVDKLLNNEYTDEEKYHWCDAVSAEINAVPSRRYKKAVLERCADDTFLLPQDCEYERIEKLLTGSRETAKQDFRTYGISRRAERRIFIPKKRHSFLEHKADAVTVVYLPVNVPIRRIELKEESITVGNGAILMDYDCPFIPGDAVEITSGGSKCVINILTRTAELDDIDGSTVQSDMQYTLGAETGELIAEIGSGSRTVDMKRVITDKTVCDAPYDEMYIDYLCAQICFYQRKHDIYQQFISRYNSRMEEYARFTKDFAAQNDNTVFRNWWVL